MEKDVKITITDRQGKDHKIFAPVDMSMNLMEVCKAFEISVQGTCGGMAMCASCQCYILSNHELPKKTTDEEAMLSEAFYVKPNSRLSCQIQIEKQLEGLRIELAPD
tara:strand:+ start:109 stop:429 length:321 start_codon:yes stop_codon:yes gene_type:complete